LVLAAMAAVAPLGLADAIHRPAGTLNNIRVLGIEGSQIQFINPAGAQARQDLDRITRLELDNEHAFNEAEVAFTEGKWDAAITGYERTLRSTNKDWLRQYVGLRLFNTAEKAGQAESSIRAYIEIVRTAPALAQGLKPSLPDAKSTFINTAIQD